MIELSRWGETNGEGKKGPAGSRAINGEETKKEEGERWKGTMKLVKRPRMETKEMGGVKEALHQGHSDVPRLESKDLPKKEERRKQLRKRPEINLKGENTSTRKWESKLK